jgi:deoxyhypusine synthase
MKREDFLREYVSHIEIGSTLTVDELVQKFDESGCFGAGRVATACDIFERMVRDKNCTVFLTVAGAIVPAGLRTVIADLIRKRRVDVVVSTAANMVHDLIEAFGGHHYKGHWLVDDFTLYKYHIYRIYDIFVTEEDYLKLDAGLSDMFGEIARENKNQPLATHEFVWEIGKRLKDSNSIVRAAQIKTTATSGCFQRSLGNTENCLKLGSFGHGCLRRRRAAQHGSARGCNSEERARLCGGNYYGQT